MTRTIKSINDVVSARLCLGCGACVSTSIHQSITLLDIPDQGIRPWLNTEASDSECKTSLIACPALSTPPHPTDCGPVDPLFGPILEIWEGFATDPEIRNRASSGGVLTALALYCLEREGAGQVLHVAQSADNPLLNQSVLSHTRTELLARAGSRYAPGSVCDGVRNLASLPQPSVVIGQPSEMAGLRKIEMALPATSASVLIRLSFFCAGSPSSSATAALIRKHGINPADVVSLRYRGKGWPGHFAVQLRGESEERLLDTYENAWALLQKSRPLAVQLWPDGTGEWADISCGDAWHRKPDGIDPGRSLVIVRTHTGRKILQNAVAAGVLQLAPATREQLEVATSGLNFKRKAFWGRRLALKLFGMPTTEHPALPLKRLWMQLSLKEQCRSVFSTAKRIWLRKLYRSLPDPSKILHTK
ncbi:Coenzyme F420 hydrogenase/dehydrogenase, beta subunit C-terminal domain [Nibricoccus sp. IMCC34717]|uniref:Coenzyme F420 hydrogenase/dehydrogenase, beta subunit C-terminal domain n=1 Tax=Nibricoccus sp. IMCC34717 TaxID=3034021 RepID=UPI003851102F